MVDVSVIASVAQNILGSLKSVDVGELSMFSFKSELQKLQIQLSAVRSILCEAEGKVLTKTNWLMELKDVLYDVDDLLDEMATHVLRQKLDDNNNNKVRRFFSGFSRVLRNYDMSHQIAKVSERVAGVVKQLDKAARNSTSNCCDTPLHLAVMGKQTDEYVGAVGRESDKRGIVELLLLDSDSDAKVVSIVGMGGLGKTTLAQLVYNDVSVSTEFDLKMWAHVSHQFDVKAVVLELLGDDTCDIARGGADLQLLQARLLNKLSAKKYLIVLDDVWTESCEDWAVMRNLLMSGRAAKGSRILLTTRSKLVATAADSSAIHELPFLSEADSWGLFHKLAFAREPAGSGRDERLLQIGQQIATKCAGLPLAIKVVGNVLCGQGLDTWLSYRDTDFANLNPINDGIMPVLKLSYDHLPTHLKNCFLYCSIFPEDYPIEKSKLNQLWLAQGYIDRVPGHSLEETTEDYFKALQQRSFFQDLKKDADGEILSCRMHALLHDLAQSMAGTEAFVATSVTNKVSEQIRHISVADWKHDNFFDTGLSKFQRIRTLLNFSYPGISQQTDISSTMLSSASHLRTLDLSHLNITSLPSSVGELIHLRYLNLSSNSELRELPGSITNLCNLQTLCLRECSRLLDLPSDLSKVVNLRHLDTFGCSDLTYMPLGMGQLKDLYMLPMFVIGDQSFASCFEQLENLKSLTNLRDKLTIRLLECSGYDMARAKEAGYLKTKKCLTNLSIQWCNDKADYGDSEALLEGLQPPANLKSLKLHGYTGMRFDSWTSLGISSSTNIVKIRLEDFPRLERLPRFSQLRHLKDLVIYRLLNLEFIESSCCGSDEPVPGSGPLNASTCFPSLENLTLSKLPKLKKWWRVGCEGQVKGTCQVQMDGSCGQDPLPTFPRLLQLTIRDCPILTSIPVCKGVEQLEMYRFSQALRLIFLSSMKRLMIDNVGYLNSQPLESYQLLSSLTIQLSDLEQFSSSKVFDTTMMSLQSLEITLCCKLRSLSGLGWKYLAALQKLRLSNLSILDLNSSDVDGDGDGMPWKSLNNLSSLELDYLPKMTDLPEGIQCMTALQTLEITSCHNLKALPDWISCLTNLQSLHIKACSSLVHLPESMVNLTSLRTLKIMQCSRYLKERCLHPNGEDLPKLKHIPHISIH